jgi:hypothetical protein
MTRRIRLEIEIAVTGEIGDDDARAAATQAAEALKAALCPTASAGHTWRLLDVRAIGAKS